MAILETLALGLGTTIAKTILSQWLQDNGVAKTIGTNLIDVIKTVVPEGLTQRRGQRQFEAIADRVAEDLTPLFERSGLSEDRQGAIAWLAEQAIEATRINADLLVAKNVDPVELAHYFIEAQPKDPHGFGFSELELQLYR